MHTLGLPLREHVSATLPSVIHIVFYNGIVAVREGAEVVCRSRRCIANLITLSLAVGLLSTREGIGEGVVDGEVVA